MASGGEEERLVPNTEEPETRHLSTNYGTTTREQLTNLSTELKTAKTVGFMDLGGSINTPNQDGQGNVVYCTHAWNYGAISTEVVQQDYNPPITTRVLMNNVIRWTIILAVSCGILMCFLGMTSLYFRSYLFYVCAGVWCGGAISLMQVVVDKYHRAEGGLVGPILVTSFSPLFAIGYLAVCGVALIHDLLVLKQCVAKDCREDFSEDLVCVMISGAGIALSSIALVSLLVQNRALRKKRAMNLSSD